MKKAHSWKRLLSSVLTLVMVFSMLVPVQALAANGSEKGSNGDVSWEKVANDSVKSKLPLREAKNSADDAADFKDSDMVRVSVILSDKSTLEKGYSAEKIASNGRAMSYRAKLKQKQDAITEKISNNVLGGKELDVVWNLTLAANAISANVPFGKIDEIKDIWGVEDVVIETRYEPCSTKSEAVDPNMSTSGSMIGTGAAWATGYTGAGSRIAIIDTGLDTDHKSFDSAAFEYALKDQDVTLLTAEDVAAVWDELNFSEMYAGDAAKTYFSTKVPFGANYVDENVEITHDFDTQTEHGSHVAGIAAANRFVPDGKGGYADALDAVHTQGVAPDAQLLVMKVFGKGGGAYDSDYMSAIEDAVVLGADAVNLSLGSANAGPSDAGSYQHVMDSLAESGVVVTMSSGNDSYWAEQAAPIGYLYSDGVNFSTDGSPGSFTNGFTVASVDNDGTTGSYLEAYGEKVFYSESSEYSNAPIVSIAGEHEFVFFDNTGAAEDGSNLMDESAAGKIAICWRGASSFYQKMDAAAEVGAIACIVANNQDGVINMDLSDATSSIPCVSILQADGQNIMANAEAVADASGNVLYYTGKITIADSVASVSYDSDIYTMSDFSSWGVPGSLELKPEITAPGGNIYSVNGAIKGGEAYENMSGTSMAAPQMAGMTALVAQYIRENDLADKTGLTPRQLAQSLLMSTAEALIEADSGSYYSVMKQGAGLANVNDAISAKSYIVMNDDANAGAADGKVKVELGDDPDRTGEYSFGFTINNMSEEDLTYNLGADFFTQDIFPYEEDIYLDTWTYPLAASVTWTANGTVLEDPNADLSCYDFNGDGKVTNDDGQALLDYRTGVRASITNEEFADFDADGDIDTYDAYLFFQQLNAAAVIVPAGKSVEITVDVTLEDIDYYDYYSYNTGAYVEGYVFVNEVTSADGALGESHSIPVLGYYGSWSEPSMFDVGSYLEYIDGAETRMPYLYAALGDDSIYENSFEIKYAGDPEAYLFGSNPMDYDPYYAPERNAINSENGDTISKINFTSVRNAADSRFFVEGEDGTVYEEKFIGPVDAAFYYTNGQTWKNTNLSLNVGYAPKGIEEGIKLVMGLTLAPEYYVDAEGNTDWDALDDAATFSVPVTIDNTAPVLADVSAEEDGTLVVSASDNQYIAAVVLYDNLGNLIDYYGADMDAQPGDVGEYAFEYGDETRLLVVVYDYAMNTATYKINFNEEELDDEIGITLDKTSIELMKSSSVKLTATVTPWGTPDESVTWTSSDESVATVNENGIVTGVDKGTATITATANADPTKSASCEVTVSTVSLTVAGGLQDEDGQPLLFTWDMENEAKWTPYALLDADINSLTYDWNDTGYIYQHNGDAYLYTVDAETGKTVAISDAPDQVPMDDMDCAFFTNMMYGTNMLVGVYAGYVMSSDAAENAFTSSVWDLSSYLSEYSGADAFTTIAWVGYDKETYCDMFYALDNAGGMWILVPDFTTGRISLGFIGTDIDFSWPLYDESQFCSMVMGDDGELYLSYFTGSTNEFYKLETSLDADGYIDNFTPVLLGNVGADVWPCSLFMVVPNDMLDSTAEKDLPAVKNNVKMIATDIAAEAIDFEDEQVGGGLNSVVSTGTMKAISKDTLLPMSVATVADDESYLTVDLTAKDLEGNDIDTTNGLLNVKFNAESLTYVSTTAYTEYSSVNESKAAEGEVLFGYVDLDAVPAGETLATVVFQVNDSKNTTVTVEDTELNDVAGGTEILENSGDFKHENTEVRGAKDPTCTEDGYTGDVWCLDCNTMIEEGKVIPATGHSYGEWETVTDPTCEDEGSKTRTCSVCGETETASIPATGHTETVVGAKEASETEDGYTGDVVCADCGKVLSKGTVIPATGTGTAKTGDNSMIGLWTALMLVSAACAAVFTVSRKRKQH